MVLVESYNAAMIMPERSLDIQIEVGNVFGVKVVSNDVAVYPHGKTISKRDETTYADPTTARSDMLQREDWAEKQAVGGGLSALIEGFAGGAYVISGFKNGEVTQIIAGLGLLGGSWKTAKFTMNADRRRVVAAEVRRKLTKEFELPDGPNVKL